MRYFIFVFLLVFGGCTIKTQLLPEASNIKILDKQPKNCKVLGKETGQKIDTMGSMGLLELRESALNDLKNKAFKLGGNSLYILHTEKGWNSFWGGTEYLIDNEIYQCR